MQAVRGHRVLTVRQENTGTRKDHGEVGFSADAQTSNLYLVFPKSIQDFAGKRVVGIKYDLLVEAEPRGPVARGRRERPAAAPPRKKEPPAPKPEPRFAVEVERSATVTTTLEVTAKTAAVARKMALEQAAETPPDMSRATLRTRILSARKVKTNH